MPIPSLYVIGNLNEIPGMVLSSELVEDAMTRARIEFRSNVAPSTFIAWGESLYRVGYVYAITTIDGDIISDDGTPVQLLAQSDELNIRNLQWQVRITLPASVVPPRPSWQMQAFWFDATESNTTIDLATVVAVPRHDVFPGIPVEPEPPVVPYPALTLYPGLDLYPDDGTGDDLSPSLALYPSISLYPAA